MMIGVTNEDFMILVKIALDKYITNRNNVKKAFYRMYEIQVVDGVYDGDNYEFPVSNMVKNDLDRIIVVSKYDDYFNEMIDNFNMEDYEYGDYTLLMTDDDENPTVILIEKQ